MHCFLVYSNISAWYVFMAAIGIVVDMFRFAENRCECKNDDMQTRIHYAATAIIH